jgi:hypothetical protein
MPNRIAPFFKTLLPVTLTLALVGLSSGTLAHNPTDRKGDYEGSRAIRRRTFSTFRRTAIVSSWRYAARTR